MKKSTKKGRQENPPGSANREIQAMAAGLTELWNRFITDLKWTTRLEGEYRLTQAFVAANVTIDLERELSLARKRLREMKANGEFEA